MSLAFFNKHKNASLIGSIIAIILVLGFNLYFYVIGPSLEANQTPQYQSADGTMSDPTAASESLAQQASAPNREFSWLPIIISVVILGAVGVTIEMLLTWMDRQRQIRDKRRQTDLQTLAQAFVAYKQANGHYPISSTYQAKYYTGINLSNDWHYYGLPTDDQMRQFLPNWPISDPSISYSAHDQTNQYIYYPRNNGQDFDLYAHLETADGQAPNYNQMDGLLQAWGHYNFKVSSQSLPASAFQPIPMPQPDSKSEASPPANPQPAAAPEPQPQTILPQPPVIPTEPAAPIATPAPPTQLPSIPQPINIQAVPTAALQTLPANVPLQTMAIDTSLQPEALKSATQAGMEEQIAEQGEISHINQLLQDIDASVVANQPAPTPPAQSSVADPTQATTTPPANGANTLSQLDRLSQAIAIKTESVDGLTPPTPMPPAATTESATTDPPLTPPVTQ